MILKFTRSRWLLVVAFMAASLGMIVQVPQVCNSAHAAQGQSPSDYCFQTDVSVTNGTGGDLTDYPVRVENPHAAMVSADQLDPRGWDVLSQEGSFTNNQHLLIQETGDTTGATWMIVTIPNGDTLDYRWYSGQNDRRRDQSIYFTGNEYVTVSDHADLDITDNLDIYVTLTISDDTARSNYIVDKFTLGTTGYAVNLVDVASVLTIRWRIDGYNCQLSWDSAWNDLKQDFRFSYVQDAGTDMFIYRNGSLETSCDSDQGAIGTNAQDLYIGDTDTLSAPLDNAELHSVDIRESSVSAVKLEFSADHMEETTETNPYTGTISDVSANSHDGTYNFDRSQTGITVDTDATTAINLSSTGLFVAELESIVDVFGSFDFDDSAPVETDSIFYQVFLEPIQTIGPSPKTTMTLVLTALGVGLGVGMFMLTDRRFMPLAVTVAGFPVWLGALNDWVEWWYAGSWAMIVLFTWFAFKRSEESA